MRTGIYRPIAFLVQICSCHRLTIAKPCRQLADLPVSCYLLQNSQSIFDCATTAHLGPSLNPPVAWRAFSATAGDLVLLFVRSAGDVGVGSRRLRASSTSRSLLGLGQHRRPPGVRGRRAHLPARHLHLPVRWRRTLIAYGLPGRAGAFERGDEAVVF